MYDPLTLTIKKMFAIELKNYGAKIKKEVRKVSKTLIDMFGYSIYRSLRLGKSPIRRSNISVPAPRLKSCSGFRV